MPDIATTERETYENMWEIDGYSKIAKGESYVHIFDSLVREKCNGLGTVLDAGCGSGRGALELKKLGYHVEMCDITNAGLSAEAKELPFFEAILWSDLVTGRGHVDWVYCTDVLEHLPAAFVGLAIQRLLDKARKGVFIAVPLHADSMGVWVGRPLHLTVESYTWWRDHLRALGRVTDARDLVSTALFMVEPR